MVEVAASKVALPDGARATPSDLRAPAVPGSMATDVPAPERLGMAVTMSLVCVEPAADGVSDLDELLLPQAAPARASTPTSAVSEAFRLMSMFSLPFADQRRSFGRAEGVCVVCSTDQPRDLYERNPARSSSHFASEIRQTYRRGQR